MNLSLKDEARVPSNQEKYAMAGVARALRGLSIPDGMNVLANVLCKAAMAAGAEERITLELVRRVYQGLAIQEAASKGGRA